MGKTATLSSTRNVLRSFPDFVPLAPPNISSLLPRPPRSVSTATARPLTFARTLPPVGASVAHNVHRMMNVPFVLMPTNHVAVATNLLRLISSIVRSALRTSAKTAYIRTVTDTFRVFAPIAPLACHCPNPRSNRDALVDVPPTTFAASVLHTVAPVAVSAATATSAVRAWISPARRRGGPQGPLFVRRVAK